MNNERKEDIPMNNQALIYNGEILVDKRTLSGSGVRDDSTLFLVINMSTPGERLIEEQSPPTLHKVDLGALRCLKQH